MIEELVERRTVRVPENKCPHCGHPLDAATHVSEEGVTPSEGDVSLCVECGEWSAFGADLTLQRPTDAQFDEIAADPDCRRARASWVRAFGNGQGVERR